MNAHTFLPATFVIAALAMSTTATAAPLPQNSECGENLSTGRDRIMWMPINLGRPIDGEYWRAIPGFEFSENPNGTARLRGAVENMLDSCERFTVDVTLTGPVPASATPPPGSPYINSFVTNNLTTNGGTINTSTWRYYTGLSGTMTGRLCYQGAILSIVGRGAALQIGDGANVKTIDRGLSSWFTASVTQQPNDPAYQIDRVSNGDFNMELGNSCACFASVVADSANYGMGLAGCNGVPTLTIQQDPLTGSNPAIDVGNTGTTAASCALFWSLSSANRFIPFIGGNLLVGAPILSVDALTIPPGGFTFNCSIRPDPCQDGWNIYLQAVCMDSCAPNGISLSRGLRLGLGSL